MLLYFDLCVPGGGGGGGDKAVVAVVLVRVEGDGLRVGGLPVVTRLRLFSRNRLEISSSLKKWDDLNLINNNFFGGFSSCAFCDFSTMLSMLV